MKKFQTLTITSILLLSCGLPRMTFAESWLNPFRQTAGELPGVIQVSSYGSHTCAVVSSGGANPVHGLKCWGANYAGMLGDGTQTNRSAPVDVIGMGSDVQMVAAGGGHTCALKTNGDVYCWGSNAVYQLGIGMTVPTIVVEPMLISSLSGTDVVAIAAGDNLTCALHQSATRPGTVDCWGALVTDYLPVPTAVSGLSNVTSIAAGGAHACATTTSGEIYCWGSNFFGQLGNGTTIAALISAPVKVNALAHPATSVSIGLDFTCALDNTGQVYCWGNNQIGQSGHEPFVSASALPEPIAVPSGILFSQISAGGAHACAVTTEGSVYCWGGNGRGQLSVQPPPTSQILPFVGALNMTSVESGYLHTAPLTSATACFVWVTMLMDNLGLL